MSAPELTGDDLTAELLDGYVQRGLVESGEHDPAMRLLLAVHLLTEATELLAAHDAEVARQAEARAWDEGAEAVYWWAEDEVNDLRPAGVIPRHIREANPYRVTDAEGAT